MTAGTKVTVRGGDDDGTVVKARDLSGRDQLLLWRNSVTGAIEVTRPARVRRRSLNAALHAND